MATTAQKITNVRTASGLDIIAGLWIVASPFVLGFATTETALWNNIISGGLIAILAAARTTGQGYRYSWPSWVTALIGVWLIVSPFILGLTETVVMWNSIVLGLIVLALASWSAASTPEER